jgi:hypothetical protein
VLAALARAGFVAPRTQRVFFRASGLVERASRRFDERTPARRALRTASVAVERLLGELCRPLTQHTTGNVLAVARKRA